MHDCKQVGVGQAEKSFDLVGSFTLAFHLKSYLAIHDSARGHLFCVHHAES